MPSKILPKGKIPPQIEVCCTQIDSAVFEGAQRILTVISPVLCTVTTHSYVLMKVISPLNCSDHKIMLLFWCSCLKCLTINIFCISS